VSAPVTTDPAALNPRHLATLVELARAARRAESAAELRFLVVNETHRLAPYRQAILGYQGAVTAISGVVSTEANAPFTQWTRRLLAHLATEPVITVVVRQQLPPVLANEWADWLPDHALWIPLPGRDGGLLLTREVGWPEADRALLREWIEIWDQSWRYRQLESAPLWRRWRAPRPTAGLRRWPWVVAAGAIAAGCLPVHLTVLAPAELVPANAAVIRAPLEGVIAAVHVQPNESVRPGQRLLSFDDVALRSRLDLAEQALLTAEAEHRQVAQQALIDARYKPQLAVLAGRVAERRVERDLLSEQLTRTQVLAPAGGIALLDDPTEWIGKPVVVGERVLRIADPQDVEIEAWVALADAVPLRTHAPVTVFLNSDPLAPLRGQLRFLAHDAVPRPDGNYAYRLRAVLTGAPVHRVGLKGTARIEGERVLLAYWIWRRPLAKIRTFLGY